MIFFKAKIELNQPLPEEKNAFHQSNAIEYQNSCKFNEINERILDRHEEKSPVPVIQIALMPTAASLLAYLAYDEEALKKGRIDIDEDIISALKAVDLVLCETEVKDIFSAEITPSAFNKAKNHYAFGDISRVKELSKKWGLGYNTSTYYFESSCHIVDIGISGKAEAKKEMKKLLPDMVLAEETDRIFSRRHPTDCYYGIPVHYKLSVQSEIAADEMSDYLVSCLYANRRLLSKKITKIYDISKRGWDDNSFSELLRCCSGTTIVFVLSGDIATEAEYASQYHRVSEVLAEGVKRYSGSILFIFMEDSSHPGFAKQLLGKIDSELDILEIKEGVGNSRQALSYFTQLLNESNMSKFYDGSDVIFEKRKFYSATEVRTKFNQWRKETLKTRVYSDYDQNSLTMKIDKKLAKNGSAYNELNTMAGLTEVKQIIRDIIASYKIQKLRSRYYDSNDTAARHMIFSGNPGTAKTTVARLMTEIMKENGILKTGAFIEVGRADLVGKYVGWTAKIVQEAFDRAMGGVLFIDEAYSLVDDSGTFGDEAINTIVQEMENRRKNVIVVFAGYPEKMRDFLAQNEGLRSRIAFHLDFPDYTPEELMQIMDKMLKDKQFVITDEARDKLFNIFKRVHKQEEYGNGRFVRNLLEQAVNRQAARISKEAGKDISREVLFELRAEDFDTNIVRRYEKEKGLKIGFAS